jgi:hypothetical protein
MSSKFPLAACGKVDPGGAIFGSLAVVERGAALAAQSRHQLPDRPLGDVDMNVAVHQARRGVFMRQAPGFGRVLPYGACLRFACKTAPLRLGPLKLRPAGFDEQGALAGRPVRMPADRGHAADDEDRIGWPAEREPVSLGGGHRVSIA